eukprot:TRINITY_DN9500_c0_g1_i1.p1 TRINITY_DN9500_c0_g1~~TRINITY_DN9500_c0_g1_i1.p1  ORF type:complete len:241 (-),score=43.77 TRINITY_DN9500_c0_g1_i1:136-795(-)
MEPSEKESTIDERYKVAYKLLLEIRDQLEHLETGQDASVFMQGKISTNINHLSRQNEQLEALIPQQPPSKREIWRIRIKQLSDECKSLRISVGTYFEQKDKQSKQEEMRNQLFERKSKANLGPSSRAQDLVKEGDSIARSHVIVDDIEQMAYSVRDSIFSQNEQIRSIQAKVQDVFATLGLSNSLIKVIQRRQFGDKVIVYTGMVLVLLLIAFLYFYVR